MDWKSTRVDVMGKVFTLGQVKGGKLYHGSAVEFKSGDTLEPGHGKNFKQSINAVSFTSEYNRALHWARASSCPAHVYEIEPIGEVQIHRVGLADGGTSFVLWEGRSPKAKVIREVKLGTLIHKRTLHLGTWKNPLLYPKRAGTFDRSDLDAYDSELAQELYAIYDTILNNPVRDYVHPMNPYSEKRYFNFTFNALSHKLLPAVEKAAASLMGREGYVDSYLRTATSELRKAEQFGETEDYDIASKHLEIAFSTLHSALDRIRYATREAPQVRYAAKRENRIFYHVTETKNIPSILKQGLIPQIGPRSEMIGESIPAIYLFKDKLDVEDAVLNWLGDLVDEDESLSILKVKLPPNAVIHSDMGSDAFEVVCKTPIPPENIVVEKEGV